jgi:cold shock CspA family protein
MIHGQVEFYDEPSGWGLIRGTDGRLYDLRAAQLSAPPPRIGERVLFEPQPAPGGPRAVAVRRLDPAPPPRGAVKP